MVNTKEGIKAITDFLLMAEAYLDIAVYDLDELQELQFMLERDYSNCKEAVDYNKDNLIYRNTVDFVHFLCQESIKERIRNIRNGYH